MSLTGYGYKPIIGVAGIVKIMTSTAEEAPATNPKTSSTFPGNTTALAGKFRDLEVEEVDEQVQTLRDSADGGTIKGLLMGDRVTRIRFTFEPRAIKTTAGSETASVADSVLWRIYPQDVIYLEAASGGGVGSYLSALLSNRASSSTDDETIGFHVLSSRETAGENSARTFQVEAVQYEGGCFAKIS